MKLRLITSLLIAFFVTLPGPVSAALVTGPSARTQFEGFRDTLGDTFVDFESIATGLYTTLPGLPLTLGTTEFRWPLPEILAPADTPVALNPTGFIVTPLNHRLMGVRAGNIPDGQARYEIVFDQPQRRAGLFRIWNTRSVTRFYAGVVLLAEHQNTVNQEFVGFIADSDAMSTWVTRIEFDGIPDAPESVSNKLYQVGEVDDLFFGSVAPLPAVTLDPTTLNFADQLIGTTSATQSITLTNSGTAVLNISSIVTDVDFGQTNDCGVTLIASANCTLQISFTPTAEGARNGSLTVSSDASSSPDAVALSGNGVPPSPGLDTQAIPVLPAWAMVILLSLMVGAAFVVLRRDNH